MAIKNGDVFIWASACIDEAELTVIDASDTNNIFYQITTTPRDGGVVCKELFAQGSFDWANCPNFAKEIVDRKTADGNVFLRRKWNKYKMNQKIIYDLALDFSVAIISVFGGAVILVLFAIILDWFLAPVYDFIGRVRKVICRVCNWIMKRSGI